MDNNITKGQPEPKAGGVRRAVVSPARVRHDSLPRGAVFAVLLLAAAAVLTLWLYRNSSPVVPSAVRSPFDDNLLYAGVMGMFQRPEFDRIMFQVEGTGLEEEELIRRRSAQSLPPAYADKSRQQWARLDSESKATVSSARRALNTLAELEPGPEFYTQLSLALECANKLRDNGRLLSENENAPTWLGLVYVNAADGLSRALAEFLKQTEKTGTDRRSARRLAASRELKKFSDGLESSISAASSGAGAVR